MHRVLVSYETIDIPAFVAILAEGKTDVLSVVLDPDVMSTLLVCATVIFTFVVRAKAVSILDACAVLSAVAAVASTFDVGEPDLST